MKSPRRFLSLLALCALFVATTPAGGGGNHGHPPQQGVYHPGAGNPRHLVGGGR
jgi:hypothetical protein